MSRIVNTDFVPGAAITATLLNDKFSEVSTATSAQLNAANFRDESVDALQFGTEIIYQDSQEVSNGVGRTGGTDYTSKIHFSAAVPIEHGTTNPRLVWPGTGIDLLQNDLLRVRWSVIMESQTINTALYSNDRVHLCDNPVWLIYLEWDITSNGLVNWVPVPNQGAYTSNYVTHEGSPWWVSQACMTIPHGFMTNGTLPEMHTDLKNLQYQRAYNYVNTTGATITIFGIRCVIKGLYSPLNSLSTGLRNAFGRTYTDPGWSDEKVKLANVEMNALIMRTK